MKQTTLGGSMIQMRPGAVSASGAADYFFGDQEYQHLGFRTVQRAKQTLVTVVRPIPAVPVATSFTLVPVTIPVTTPVTPVTSMTLTPVATPVAVPGTLVPVKGNTYPVKEQIKALGGRWDGALKAWKVPPEKLSEALALVANAPKTPYTGPRGYKRNAPHQGAMLVTPSKAMTPSKAFIPCGYPGCSPVFCDECDGKGSTR